MDLRDYLNIARKRWASITILTVLGLVAALGLSLVTTPLYTAKAQVFVSVQGSDTTGDLLQGANFTVRQVRSYVQLATTRRVLNPVIEQFGLPESTTQLAERITASSPLDTSIIDITATDASPQQAAELANAVSQALADTVSELEAPSSGGDSPVVLSVVQTADIPIAPSSPNLPLNLGLGLITGLAAGLALALLRHRLDTRIHDVSDVEELTDVSIMGRIPAVDVTDGPLILHEGVGSPRAESYRRLRTNLQFLNVDRTAKAITFTSAISGEGKTSTTLNLAISLADAGNRVVVVDADLRRPSVADYLGLEGDVGLTTILIGRATIADVVQPVGTGNLHVITAGQIPPNPSELLGSKPMAALVEELEGTYDYVLIDTAPLLPVTDGAILARLVGGAVLVVGIGDVHQAQLETAMDALESVNARILGIVVNRAPARSHGSYGYDYGYSYGYSQRKPDERKGNKNAEARPDNLEIPVFDLADSQLIEARDADLFDTADADPWVPEPAVLFPGSGAKHRSVV